MSYDPSQAQGTRAVQVDINGTTVLSDDVISHSITSFNARSKYFIESQYYVPVNGSVSGLILWYNWGSTATFQPFGGTVRANLVSGTTTGTDNNWICSNTPGTAISMVGSSTGSASIVTTSRKMFTYLWRIQ